MLEQKEIVLGEETITLRQFPASKGLEYGLHMARLLSGAAEGVGEPGKGMLEAEVNFGRIVSGLFGRLDARTDTAFLRQMVQSGVVLREGVEFATWFDSRFSGAYGELFTLLADILEFNYAEVLEPLKKSARHMLDSFSDGTGNGASIPSSSGPSGQDG